jgi:hypothetical protein
MRPAKNTDLNIAIDKSCLRQEDFEHFQEKPGKVPPGVAWNTRSLSISVRASNAETV